MNLNKKPLCTHTNNNVGFIHFISANNHHIFCSLPLENSHHIMVWSQQWEPDPGLKVSCWSTAGPDPPPWNPGGSSRLVDSEHSPGTTSPMTPSSTRWEPGIGPVYPAGSADWKRDSLCWVQCKLFNLLSQGVSKSKCDLRHHEGRVTKDVAGHQQGAHGRQVGVLVLTERNKTRQQQDKWTMSLNVPKYTSG